MSLAAGTKLGPYEIVAPLGAGGMGEVYRARDNRLGRDVALKILPDAANRDRFEQEARAIAALNHPNIMAVFDVGENYFVSELVDGDSLRHLPPQPLRKSIDLAAQIADGLAAAHAAGIVHRDLKPENIVLTRDGRAKILDFGLAKVQEPVSDPDATQAFGKTDPGVVMGTVGYMSPEQVRGRAADARSDIFSFGLVLYEMLGGKRAFTGDSAVEVMNAILTVDPPALPESIPPPLVQIVDHCLEKNPVDRFQSARDLAFALRSFGSHTHASGQIAALPAPAEPEDVILRRPWPWIAVGLALIAAAVTYSTVRNFRSGPELPRYTRLTYDRGYVSGARFAADGKTIAYSASWNGQPFEIFSTRVESMDSRPLSISNAHVFAISNSGDLAIGLDPKMTVPPQGLNATLARVPLAGGAPRPLLQDVYAADYEPKGDRLAIVRMVDSMVRVEFPQGKVLYQTAGWVSSVRFSRDGKRLAITDHPLRWDDRGDVAVLDLEGHKTVVSSGWEAIEGIAWSPSGDELWFAGARSGSPTSLYAADLKGKQREILTSPSALFLRDVGTDGRILMASDGGMRSEMTAVSGGDARERNLAYLTQSSAVDLSGDGLNLLFTEGSSGSNYSVCLRKTDGSPVVVLGEGAADSLSADGRWALSVLLTRPPELLAIPTGAGETVHVPKASLDYGSSQWLPDSKSIIFEAREPGKDWRVYQQSIFPMGAPKAIGGDGMLLAHHGISPDGKLLAARHTADNLAIYPVEGGAPLSIAGFNAGDVLLRWGPDQQSLYFAAENGCHLRIYKLNWRTGVSQTVRELMPDDQAGVFGMQSIVMTPDASTLVYGFSRLLVNLQMIDGVK